MRLLRQATSFRPEEATISEAMAVVRKRTEGVSGVWEAGSDAWESAPLPQPHRHSARNRAAASRNLDFIIQGFIRIVHS